MGDINDNRGKEAGFRRAYKKTNHVEIAGTMNERHEHGHNSPRNHDACDPPTCAPTLCDQRTRNFEDQVSDKEHSGPQTHHPVVEAEISRHLQCRGAHVHTIQERDDVKQEEKRKNSPSDSFSRALSYRWIE